MTTADPIPPLEIETIPAEQLENGMVLPRPNPQKSVFGELKTIEAVTFTKPAKTKFANVMFTDGSAAKWPINTQVVVMADSLPAVFWRQKYVALRDNVAELVRVWRGTANNLQRPARNGEQTQSPAVRDGRSQQANQCAAAAEALIVRPGMVIR